MSEWDRQTTRGAVDGPQWVSAAEAADVAGVTPGTVRYWARNGLIVSEVVGGPTGEKTLVRLDEVLQHARKEEPGRHPVAPRGPASGPVTDGEIVTDLPAQTSDLAPILKSIPEIMAQLTAATDRAARAETKVEFLSAQLTDLRRRLAEAEAAGDAAAGATVTLPEEWDTPTPDPFPPESSEEQVPSSGGWPAPPPETLHDEPVEPVEEAPEPGPESIDWTSGAPDAGTDDPAPVEEAPAPAATEGISLDDIWNQPATREPEPRPALEPEPAGVSWDEPSGRAPAPPARPGGDDSSPPPRPANAPVPDDDFYGPRRRRWFKRRR